MAVTVSEQRSASKPTRPSLRPPAMATLFTLAFALGGWRSGLSRLTDNSFFWHLTTGGWILDHGIPRGDIYSFTAQGSPWVVQSWLAEVLYASLERAFGPFGVRVLGGLTGALVGAISYRFALRLARDRLRAAVLAIGAIGASFTLWAERPLFLGILLMVGLLWIVEVPDSWIGRHALVTLPVLMWLWVNIHGTFALGFTFVGLHLLGRWLEGAPPWQGHELLLTKASLLAGLVTLANPYGPKMLLFPIELLGRGEILKRVIEWSSPNFRSPQGIAFAAWLALFIGCVAMGSRRPGRRDLVVSLPFVLLALWAQRNIAVAPLVGLAVAARAVATPAPRPDKPNVVNAAVGVLVVALAGLFTMDAALAKNFDFSIYPVKAMRVVEEEGLLGRRLMTDDAWAGYVILEYWPEQRVFVDDRYDMYPKAVMKDFIRVSDAEPDWRKILDRYDIEVVVWARGHPVAMLLDREPGWRRIHRDKRAAVYVRTS